MSSVNTEEPQKLESEAVEGEEENQQLQLLVAEDKLALQFMDSVHNYLSLFDALSSTLGQGWLDLASARHSMGASRINSSLLDLKFHPAATTSKIVKYQGEQPCFMLRKWVSSEHENSQLEDKNGKLQDSSAEVTAANNLSGLADDEEVQKERSKSLSVFGILISPKLRSTQLSFEKALETLIELANMRSSLIHSFHQLHRETEDTEE
ncbi:uncharacterized protein LOC130729156 [Lotus japonicus]|uniref:Vacuolar ATPase assembly protein VMA22 n=1 Tax=Lotus japonicus TaxID=34305 RepID=I3SFT0_LOTJA|nr:uncharacterized protein LOC130729156 [Lotus japonicus]XP_057436781.1 uncharacterized protein LOC130729156 [Lotus japonicus]AFK39122.1 unknown [Lotus japonicus]